MANLFPIAKRLIQALNFTYDYKLALNTKQFYGVDGRTHNYYSLNKAEWVEDLHRYNHTEIYASPSLVRVVFYLRDLWFTMSGEKLPTDQEKWNSIRSQLRDKGNFLYQNWEDL